MERDEIKNILAEVWNDRHQGADQGGPGPQWENRPQRSRGTLDLQGALNHVRPFNGGSADELAVFLQSVKGAPELVALGNEHALLKGILTGRLEENAMEQLKHCNIHNLRAVEGGNEGNFWENQKFD
uniref:Uncharacterized protein n=1 Tax=Bracon brevicornis TaxID=1563983 RepID=A0A6V7JG21_9HYME